MWTNEELGWLAFRYIADEMATEEREAFERRLLDDQRAREAVAEAVSLTQAIAALPAVALPAPPVAAQGWLRPVAWMAAGAAISLAAVLLVQPFQGWAGRPHLHGSRGAAATASASDRLAIVLAWFRLCDADAESAERETAPDETHELTFSATGEVDADPEAGVPGWLLAALSTAPELQRSSPSHDD